MTEGRHRKTVENAETPPATGTETAAPARRFTWSRLLVHGVLPGVALVLAMTAGMLKWLDSSVRYASVARIESVQAAKDSAVAMLSYRPDTVQKDLGAARDRLAGGFRDSYSQLTRDVIIPGAQEKQIAARAQVSAAGSVSATADHAVVVLFVNQIVTVGDAAPTSTPSSVRVTLDKVGNRWLISAFDTI